MDAMHYDDNDYLQEEYERLIGIYEKKETPYFLLDEDYFVKWANDAAERLYPDFTQPDGILNILEEYPEERFKLENEAISVDIPLEEGNSSRHMNIHNSAVMGEFYTINIAYIYTRIDLSTLSREEVEKRVAECEMNYRGPISSIFVHLRNLMMREECQDNEDGIRSIANNSVQLLRGMNMNAENTRISQGIAKHALRIVNLTEFLSALFETAAELMYMESVDLCFVPPASRLLVVTEPEYILSSIGQLLSNAIRYRLPGTPILMKCTADYNHVQIAIVNHGAPIPQEVCTRMFDNNFSFNPDGDSISGNGIGLTIARGYAEFLGGTLTFEKHGEDTVFKLTLPLLLSGSSDGTLWHMDKQEMRMRLCVLLSDALNTSEEILSCIG